MLHVVDSGVVTFATTLILNVLKAWSSPRKKWSTTFNLWTSNIATFTKTPLIHLPEVTDLRNVGSWTGAQRRSLLCIMPVTLCNVMTDCEHEQSIVSLCHSLIDLVVALRATQFTEDDLKTLSDTISQYVSWFDIAPFLLLLIFFIALRIL